MLLATAQPAGVSHLPQVGVDLDIVWPIAGRALIAPLRTRLFERAVRTPFPHILGANAAHADDGSTRLTRALSGDGQNGPLRMATRAFPALSALARIEKRAFAVALATVWPRIPGGCKARLANRCRHRGGGDAGTRPRAVRRLLDDASAQQQDSGEHSDRADRPKQIRHEWSTRSIVYRMDLTVAKGSPRSISGLSLTFLLIVSIPIKPTLS